MPRPLAGSLRWLRAAVVLALLVPGIAPPGAAVETGAATPLRGDRLLVVTAADQAGGMLAGTIAELYAADVTVRDPLQYAPWIDEYAYDGLVYVGSDYYQPPPAGLVADVQRTTKPVLWVGYHAWMLGETFLSANGLVIRDRRAGPASTLVSSSSLAMASKDVTAVEASDRAVLYSLIDARGRRVPGAVHAGNFTYVAYVPDLNLYAPEFGPFVAAIRAAFGTSKPPHRAAPPDYPARVAAARHDTFRTGIHLPVYVATTTPQSSGYDSASWHANLVRIRESGAEWVDLVRTYEMADVKASTVEADARLTPTFDSLADIIADAHEIGLLVRLHVAIGLVSRTPLEWHGMIAPTDRRRWWASFAADVRELGEFARRHEVESVMLGTEFTSMQGDTEEWRELIAALRTDVGYRGLIGYGVNYNSTRVDWLDALDFFGISAYWPLSDRRDPDLATLMRSWSSIDAMLRRWKASHPNVALELGEIGYVSQPYASVLPFSWKAHRGAQQSLIEQLRCYESLRAFLSTATYIAGVHFFASTAEDTDPASRGYTPFGKPAEAVMKRILRMR